MDVHRLLSGPSLDLRALPQEAGDPKRGDPLVPGPGAAVGRQLLHHRGASSSDFSIAEIRGSWSGKWSPGFERNGKGNMENEKWQKEEWNMRTGKQLFPE